MARLSVLVLGPLQITLDDQPLTGFVSDKVRALLAYLTVEAEEPHRREQLAGLLWPDWPDRSARASLRTALTNLRQVLRDHEATPPFLHISRQTIQFNSASNAWIDVTAFTDLVQAKGSSQQAINQLEQAVALYGGDFLEGFSIGDSPAFEEWALLNRERLRRLVIEALCRLAECREQRGEYGYALQHAWRQVELDPWRENAHRQLMRLLALNGQRGAALAQYEACQRLLADELGVAPAAETMRLYEQIREGKLTAPVPSRTRVLEPAPEPPAFLDEEEHIEAEAPVFVGRERELAQLGNFLDLMLTGEGRVVFIVGEAGSGKTALAQEFARRAQEAHADLVVASGNCNAYTGTGDPYLPFREILRLLTVDAEAKWAAGAITREHALRLWHAFPVVVEALLKAGPDLVDAFVPGAGLFERAAAYAPGETGWLACLSELAKRKASDAGTASLQQADLLEQYTKVLRTLAHKRPLLLVVDDLQWADTGSVSLLFHLGRHLADNAVLMVGAYRPEELALGRHRERHPLEPVVNELRRDLGEISVTLGQAPSQDFVEVLLDREPNRLGAEFRTMLYRQTRGHPLFTVELLRGLKERGELVQDTEGYWVEAAPLDWKTLPARVQAVIAERIGRLDQPLQDVLWAASVEGEVFTAEVVARCTRASVQETVRCLSGDLDRRHQLVQAQSVLRIGEQHLSRYRFRHILFQQYSYGSLDPVERTHLHGDVGHALEDLYGDQTEEIVVQLAHHFQEAGIAEKAVGYLHQAGSHAVRLSANEEAIAHFNKALALLKTLPDVPEHLEQELGLQLALGAPLEAARGYAAPETGRAYARAHELCQQLGHTPQLLPALLSLGAFHYARAECEKSLRLTEQALSLAEQTEDTLHVAIARWLLGVYLLNMGELAPSLEHLEHMIAFYDPEQHASLAFTLAQDPGVSALAWASLVLWLLGFPDQALQRSRESLALAHELEHPFTLSFALWTAGTLLHQLRREDHVAREYNEAMLQLSMEERFPLFVAGGNILRGWATTLAGQAEVGIAGMRKGLDSSQAMGTKLQCSHWLALLAEALASAGQAEEALDVLAEALALVEEIGERYYEAEIHRLHGELLLMQDNQADAEARIHLAERSFQRAIKVARRQQARSWELRATTSLARLWRKQGRQEEAREMLAEIYGWFTEGFDTTDLGEAKALLKDLGQKWDNNH